MLSWKEISFLDHALAAARRQWRTVAQSIRTEHALGPRGPWILSLIATGQVASQAELARIYKCSRSLITLELTRLSDAGLISTHKCDTDRRKFNLGLTPLGEDTHRRLCDFLVEMLEDRLTDYTRDEIMFCARMLHDLAATPRRRMPKVA